MEKGGFVYMLGSRSGVLYIGVTNDLERCLSEHKSGSVEGFTKKYRVARLLWYECYDRIEDEIGREKQVKNWRREKKARLKERENPDYEDISQEWYESAGLL
ncbi:MAG: GIY-YIG nuclease family protein [Rhodospirillaceae bacterium]|nr:GIY-YIG nuclease family protein [Rhodospirillaceae bacterium]